ncbi:hypothetical protein GGU11DRAFT_762057 [Lentinula aff. detonsa]|nr:hypothetical protein GGU11DRAFT_762057 [Lentinula aff. detonsa]
MAKRLSTALPYFQLSCYTEGPLYNFAWSPNSKEFGVATYGFMPAKTVLFEYIFQPPNEPFNLSWPYALENFNRSL